MKKKSRSLARIALPLLLCVLFLIPTAYADLGPKPEVTITVINAPEGELYLDLLAEGEARPAGSSWFNAEDEAAYDPAVLDSLRSLEGDGWVLAYSTGLSDKGPTFGGLRPQEDGTWFFFYIGLPETFRVAAATADQAQAVDVPYTRSFFSHIVYDWETNTVREATAPPLRFLARLASTLIPTLLIEGIIFWLFGFREKRSWLVFLAVNIVTQLGLHLAIGASLPMSGWYFPTYLFTLILPELVIWAAEAIVYALLLQEHSRYKRIGYAMLANAASFLLGYFPLHLLYGFLKRL